MLNFMHACQKESGSGFTIVINMCISSASDVDVDCTIECRGNSLILWQLGISFLWFCTWGVTMITVRSMYGKCLSICQEFEMATIEPCILMVSQC